jgi:hypothetical protein
MIMKAAAVLLLFPMLAACASRDPSAATPDAGATDVDLEGGVELDGSADASATEGSADSPPDSPVPCAAAAADGVAIAALAADANPLDALGYPPYALDGCTLIYLAPPAAGQTWGELRRRDLATGAETVLAPPSETPRRPTIAGDVVAWEAVVGNKTIVRVTVGSDALVVSGPFDHAGEPRATADAVVFTAWLAADDTSDTDVYLVLPASRQLVAIATGPGQQRFADVSRTLVAVSDFSEDPTGTFSAVVHRDADVVVFDRGTLARTVRHLPGKQAFPMLGATTHLGYLDWGLVTPEPKFSQYTVRVGVVASDPAADANVKGSGPVVSNTAWVRPSVSGDTIVWVDESAGLGGLFARPLDLSSPAKASLSGAQLLEPVAGRTLNVAATPVGGGYALRGVAP